MGFVKPDVPQLSNGAGLPAGLPGGWTFGRDFPCPRCHYNLRALHNPQCPECGLEFRWQSILAVVCPTCAHPLHEEDGSLCPRCFETLNWAQLLNQTDPRQRFEFEFAVPVFRPFVNTLVRTLSPWQFWSDWRLDAPSNPARLDRYFGVSLTIGLIGLILPFAARLAGTTHIDLWDWLALVAAILMPAGVALLTIMYLGRTRVAPWQPPPKTHRVYAYSASILAWCGTALAIAALGATGANYVYAISVASGSFSWRPGSALYFSSNHLANWLQTGQVAWNWHPIEAWFNIGVYGLLAVLMLVWWPLFLMIAIRRGFRMRRRYVLQVVLAIFIISTLLVLIAWLELIPDSPLFKHWVSFST